MNAQLVNKVEKINGLKMKILLINPPSRENAVEAPLGLLYIAQPLLDSGHEIKVIDVAFDNLSKEEVISKL